MEDVGVEGGGAFFGVEFGVTELWGLLLDSLLLIETRSNAFTVYVVKEFLVSWNTLKDAHLLHSHGKPLLTSIETAVCLIMVNYSSTRCCTQLFQTFHGITYPRCKHISSLFQCRFCCVDPIDFRWLRQFSNFYHRHLIYQKLRMPPRYFVTFHS